jgi:hypothetical protein
LKKLEKKLQKKIFFSLSFYLIFFVTEAQYADTLHQAFNSKKSFDCRYESKNSFFEGDRIEVVSLKLGTTFGKKISIGGGYCWLNSELNNSSFFPNLDGAVKNKNNRFTFRYLCYYVDFVFHKTKRWTLSSQVEFGGGFSKFQYLNNGEPNTGVGDFVGLYNPAINIRFKIFKWLGIGSTVGYRFMLVNDIAIVKRLNSPIYSAGVFVCWDELTFALFPKSKQVKKWLGESEW